MNANVFSSLAKSSSGSVEDYLTEAFVFVVRLLLQRSTSAGLEIINSLCGNGRGWSFLDPKQVDIQTQVTTEEGRPDIEIRGDPDILVYVEVKHDSALGVQQLERYRAQLDESGHSKTLLVLLTRSRSSSRETTLQSDGFHHVCWYEIYNWLANAAIQDETCQYMVDSLVLFLEEKRMSMKKVTWEYINGVPAFLNLIAMMEAAISEALPDVKIKRTAGLYWRGFYLDDEYWWAIRYARPLLIVFENNMGNDPITFKRDLDLEVEHFFSLSKDEQFERLVSFLRVVRADARNLMSDAKLTTP